MGGGGSVGVAGDVGGAHVEGVAAVGEARVVARGLAQAPQAPPSRRHSKVEPPSLELKVKVAAFDPLGFVGLESIVVCGAARSIVNVRVEGVSTLPATSVARTRTV